MRSLTKHLTTGALAALAVLVLAPTSASAQRAHLGVRAGYNFDYDDPSLGGHFSVPIARRLELYPSMDVYLPETGTRLAFNGDLKYRFRTPSAWEPYLGGGVQVLHRRIGDAGNNDVGANLLGGVETRVGTVHPFLEGRVVLQDNTSFQLATGLNITLFGR